MHDGSQQGDAKERNTQITLECECTILFISEWLQIHGLIISKQQKKKVLCQGEDQRMTNLVLKVKLKAKTL